VCAEIKRKLIEWGHIGRVYILGDATSKKQDVKQEQGMDLFALIIQHLKEYKPERKIEYSNPNVIMSANFVNSILEGNVQGLSIGVDKSCTVAIADFENTKEDKNGKIDKTIVRDPVTKISYQPWGHMVDILRYMICTTYKNEYLKYQRFGLNPNIRPIYQVQRGDRVTL
jgi:hypothetical protein